MSPKNNATVARIRLHAPQVCGIMIMIVALGDSHTLARSANGQALASSEAVAADPPERLVSEGKERDEMAPLSALPVERTPVQGRLAVQRSLQTGLAMFVRSEDHLSLPVHGVRNATIADPIEAVLEYGHLFGVAAARTQLEIERTDLDAQGSMHTTYRQVNRGVPVFGGFVKVHQDHSGDVSVLNGHFFPSAYEVNTLPSISVELAIELARQLVDPVEAEVERSNLVIVDPGWYGDPPRGPHLAYFITLVDRSIPLREAYFVDAHNGDILDRWSELQTVMDRRVLDDSQGGIAVRTEGDPATGDYDADAAYDYAGDFYQFLANAFGRDSYDDAGTTLQVTVHWNDPESNCPRAVYDGAGTSYCTNLITDDVIGHEFGHALTEHATWLMYQNQPGQLNEHFSDVWGEMVDLFNGGAAFPGTPEGTSWLGHATGPGTDTPNELRDDGCSTGVGLRISTPSGAAGYYVSLPAQFGPSLTTTGITAPVVVADPVNACNSDMPFTNAGDMNGKIVVVDRGVCPFTEKVVNAQNSGALAVVVVNTDTWSLYSMSGTNPSITIPSVLIMRQDGDVIETELAGSSANATLRANSYSGGVRWLRMEDNTAGFSVRDLYNPTCSFDPDRANHPWQQCQSEDSGGAHGGSAIPNHAFAIVVDGKNFNGYNVSGIGPIKATAIWYRALTTYLSLTSDFRDAYFALTQSAQDLVGTFPNDPRTGAPSTYAITQFDALQVEYALRAVEMDTPGSCGAGLLLADPPSSGACNTVYSNDFESGVNDWTVSNTNPPTPYDWFQAPGNVAPVARQGTVWWGADSSVGNCGTQDESAVHSLFSPLISVTDVASTPFLRFTHFIASENDFDGGNIRISADAGPWTLVPPSAFTYNPYNGTLSTVAEGNTNPLAGEPVFIGVGGWGTSVIDLSGFVYGTTTIRVRFDFGKDGCNPENGWYIQGWFIDDFQVQACVPPPSNDDCSGASLLPIGTAEYGTTNDASTDNAPTCDGVDNTSPGVWYKVVGNGNRVTASTCTQWTDFDSQISVYCSDCDTLSCVSANDDNCIGYSATASSTTWCSEAGRTYFILVHGFGDEFGDYSLEVTEDFTPCSDSVDCSAVTECGNNVLETGEQCDGTDDSACPGECRNDCTCLAVYVDSNAPLGRIDATAEGDSWCTAYPTLQAALGATTSGHVIRVADGSYRPDTAGLADPREATFTLVNGVSIEGGYAGCGAEDPNARDTATFRTILTCDLNGDDSTVGDAENCYHVVTGSGTDATAVLDGVYVRAGNSNGPPGHEQGGGMLIMNGSPKIIDCRFEGNSAAASGGAILVCGSPQFEQCEFKSNHAPSAGAIQVFGCGSVSFLDCLFQGNTATTSIGGALHIEADTSFRGCEFDGNNASSSGGAIFASNNAVLSLTSCQFTTNVAGHAAGALTIWQGAVLDATNCSFTANSATFGGAVDVDSTGGATFQYCSFSSNSAAASGGAMNVNYDAVISDCTLSNNTAVGERGGAINAGDGSMLIITRSRFKDNQASQGGGAVSQNGSTGAYTDCWFIGNETLGSSGGGVISFSSNPRYANCIFTGNVAPDGSALASFGPSAVPQLLNSTITANTADGGSAVYNGNSGNLMISNSIIWNNSGGTQIGWDGTGATIVRYNLIQGGWVGGTGIITDDPLFVDAAGSDGLPGTEDDDLHLLPFSPAIDSGDLASVRTLTDLDGNDRVVDGDGESGPNVDMGAYERPAPVCGNNIHEGGEECDGTDDSACPGGCQTACVCGSACPAPAPAEPESTVLDLGNGSRIRYLSFTGGSPGTLEAARVQFDIGNGPETMWVQEPYGAAEASGNSGTGDPGFWAATLDCTPQFVDWTQYDSIHVQSQSIIPGNAYEISLVTLGCEGSVEGYSDPLAVNTSAWGDLVSSCVGGTCGPPNGVADFDDISAVVDKFRNLPGAPKKSRADVAPGVLDFNIDFTDIPAVVDGFRGLPYQYAAPRLCP